MIAKMHGDDSDDWIGKSIVLYVMDVQAFDEIVSAIRVKPPKKVTASKAPKVEGVKTGTEVAAEQELINRYWTTIKNLGATRKHGLDLLQKSGGDFVVALKTLEDDVPF